MAELEKPKISWWNIDNNKRFQINPDLFGSIEAGGKSEIIKFLMWNNRGGAENVSNTSWDGYTEDRSILGYAGVFHFDYLNDLSDFLDQGWIRMVGIDNTMAEADIQVHLNDDIAKVIGDTTVFPFTCAAGVKDFLSGKANDGSLNNVSNYAIIAMQILVPENAVKGKRNFSFCWQMI